MPRTAADVPAESDLLCETCGYTLNGLSENSRCPECGNPIADNLPGLRSPSAWELHPSLGTFLRVTAAVIFRPGRFYRGLAVRGDDRATRAFARRHYLLAAVLFSLVALLHLYWVVFQDRHRTVEYVTLDGIMVFLALVAAVVYWTLFGLTLLAAKLTNWEATYRGLRLPYPLVVRALFYHSAHYLPVAAMTLVTVGGYQMLLWRGAVTGQSGMIYLYTLCGQVVASAIYLFQTYWIGMRKLMYANR